MKKEKNYNSRRFFFTLLQYKLQWILSYNVRMLFSRVQNWAIAILISTTYKWQVQSSQHKDSNIIIPEQKTHISFLFHMFLLFMAFENNINTFIWQKLYDT